ncbi:MAG: regulatory iron-sulfur-containing complex subunit RicT [Saprospiraceae bacterium]
MGCSSCSSGAGTPTGCGDKGHCSTGGCNKLNTFDWLTVMDIEDPSYYHFAEVSFKNGARKTFYKMTDHHQYTTGDLVVVDIGTGNWDVGRVSLMGDLVRLQMKKKNFKEDRAVNDIIRRANNRDVERMTESRNLEKPALIKARVIARSLGLDMKVGDVEYQADQKKATFFYTADGWVDFRELVKQYAKEFKVKIEMRQIGSRQESARIGGIGSCGRELCCSTWLTDFKTVSTTAARYQNIAINQSKLSGQCGRLKCCLNYELDMYIEELEKYPNDVEYLKSKNGNASLVKVDIFKGMLYYLYEPQKGRSMVMPLSPEEVRRIKAMNDKGQMPDEIIATVEPQVEINKEEQYFDVTGAVELPIEIRKKKKKKKPQSGNNPRPQNPNPNSIRPTENKPDVVNKVQTDQSESKPNSNIVNPDISSNSKEGTSNPDLNEGPKKKKKKWYNKRP